MKCKFHLDTFWLETLEKNLSQANLQIGQKTMHHNWNMAYGKTHVSVMILKSQNYTYFREIGHSQKKVPF